MEFTRQLQNLLKTGFLSLWKHSVTWMTGTKDLPYLPGTEMENITPEERKSWLSLAVPIWTDWLQKY